jgi:hypothetical protein
MPLWLVAIGRSTPIPNLTAVGLISHIIWGGTLGVSYSVLSRVDE